MNEIDAKGDHYSIFLLFWDVLQVTHMPYVKNDYYCYSIIMSVILMKTRQ